VDSFGQTSPVGSIVESMLRGVLAGGLRLVELAMPDPPRLSTPLPGRPGAKADPVILVGGFSNNPKGWDRYVRSLREDGFQVFVFDVPAHGLADMHAAAAALTAFVAQVRYATSAAHVDLVGFSEGGLLARMAVTQGATAQAVDSVVTLATPHNGIGYGGLVHAVEAVPVLGPAFPVSADQMVRGSQLLRELDAADLALREHGPVRYESIHQGGFDGFVSGVAATLAGVPNVAVHGASLLGWLGLDGPDHYSMYRRSSAGYDAVRAALLTPAGQPLPGVVPR
jgi:pimeloyl-ACP methyl ester carboxylesterase